MNRFSFAASLGLLSLALVGACSNSADDKPDAADKPDTAAAQDGGPRDTAMIATDTAPIGQSLIPFPATCDPAPAKRSGNAATLTLQVKPTIGGKIITPGPELADGAKATYHVSELRFFLTHVEFIAAGGARTLGQLVDAAGAPLPYDTQLVDIEKPDSLTVRVQAPAGSYSALGVGVGLSPACNVAEPAKALYPLNPSGGMFWSWTTGYIFVRIGGDITTPSSPLRSLAAHGGIMPASQGAVRVQAAGAVTLAAAGTTLSLTTRFDDLMGPAAMGDHIAAGVKVIEALPTASVFSVAP